MGVDHEPDVMSVSGYRLRGLQDACIVDQHIQMVVLFGDFIGQPVDSGQVREVSQIGF